LKNSASVQEQKISRDIARFDLEEPTGYRPAAVVAPETSLFGFTQA
jgi:hypothetical protein